MKTKSKTMATKTVSGTEEHNGSGANASQNKNKKNGKDLHALLESGLKDIHSAEKQLVEALPEVIQACHASGTTYGALKKFHRVCQDM
jgi:hypothetical protein